MSDDDKGSRGLMSWFIKDAGQAEPDDEPAAATAAPTPAPSLLSTLQPQHNVAATVTPATVVTPTRVTEILAAAQEQIPETNANFKLNAAMQSIETIIADAGQRRAAAMNMLQSQGVSPDQVNADAVAARQIMSGYITKLAQQAEEKRAAEVTAVRTQAAALIAQSDALEEKIAEMRAEQEALKQTAQAEEVKAATAEATINSFIADTQAALAAVSQ